MWGKKKGFLGDGGGVLLGTTWVFVSTLGSAKEMLGKLKKHQAKHWEIFFLDDGGTSRKCQGIMGKSKASLWRCYRCYECLENFKTHEIKFSLKSIA
jgi:hypothetical protein